MFVQLLVASCCLLAVSAQTSQYVTCIPGTGLPLILSAPHGGSQEPGSIPTRDYGCWDGSQCIWSHNCGSKDESRCAATTTKDLYTLEQATEMRDLMCTHFGECPTLVLNLLHRRKFDANREINEATFNVPVVMDAYDAYHACINAGKASVTADFGAGLFLDIHGHGHPNVWAELGYLITGSNLDNSNFNPSDTSINNLASNVVIPFDALLRGLTSFGGLLEAEGFTAVPSPNNSGPDGESYFPGGENTREHGSRTSGTIDAIQIESPRQYRDQDRAEYVVGLTNVVEHYLEQHYGYISAMK